MSSGPNTLASSVARTTTVAALALASILLAACAGSRPSPAHGSTTPPESTLATRPLPGIPLGGKAAPDFGLVDQFGRRHRLSDFRGKVVLLTFIDSHCTTICPLTGALLRRTQDLLGQQASRMQLLAVNVNPQHTRVADVLEWSRDQQMMHRWLFLTGPVSQLRAVWQAYGIDTKMVHGDDEHTAMVVGIDPGGREQTAFPIATKSGIAPEASSLAEVVRALVTR